MRKPVNLISEIKFHLKKLKIKEKTDGKNIKITHPKKDGKTKVKNISSLLLNFILLQHFLIIFDFAYNIFYNVEYNRFFILKQGYK